jgi:lactate permease
MSIGFLSLIAAAPILLALIMMAGLHWPATRAMPIAWLASACAAVLVWKMPVALVLAATLAGFGNAMNVLIIVLGAIVLLFTLRESGGMATINSGLATQLHLPRQIIVALQVVGGSMGNATWFVFTISLPPRRWSGCPARRA